MSYQVLNEVASRQFLEKYGVKFNCYAFAATKEEAVKIAEDMKYPLVMKMMSPAIVHKSDFGGVVLGLKNVADVQDAFEKIYVNAAQHGVNAEQIDGVVIQEMVSGIAELMVGLKKDPIFGPVVVVGSGGILVELMKDVSLGICPLNDQEIEKMLYKLKGYKLLNGFRGKAKGDIKGLIAFIKNISDMAISCPEIEEMDLNPVIVGAEGSCVMAVDARVVIATN